MKTKRIIVKGIGFFLCGIFAGIAQTKSEKPNVLFVIVDDLRPELGYYGAEQVQSPNMDKLASQSLVFNNAYCNIPVCGASRASILTGILPTKDRFKNYYSRADQDAPNAKTLPQVFKESGYTTISLGKVFHILEDSNVESWSEPAWIYEKDWQISFDPSTKKYLSKKGRGRIYESPDIDDYQYHDGKTALKAMEELNQLKESKDPFFMVVGFVKPHMPFYAPQKYWNLYNRDSIKQAPNSYRPRNAPKALKGSEEFRSYYLDSMDVNSDRFHKTMKHGYLACVSYTDHLIGEVLQELDNTGLSENTIIVLWGDHGWNLGEHNFWGKHNTMELAMKIPLMIHLPGMEQNKLISNAIVESSDIYPTLCELAGIEVPNSVQGKSFMTLFDNPDQKFRDYAYSRYHDADAVVDEQYNLTVYNIDTGNEEVMLFDHKNDPEENENVAQQEEYEEVVSRMRRFLSESMKRASNLEKK